MLVGAHDRRIDIVDAPVQLAPRIGALLERGQDALPDARRAPAVEAARHRLPWAIPLGQVTPGCTGAVNSQDAVDDAAMIVRRSAGLGFLGWEQRTQPLPLIVRQFSLIIHTRKSTRRCKRALGVFGEDPDRAESSGDDIRS